MRILLGWAWTYLIVAELIGTSSGITFFINQQARYRHFDNVYAAIIMIGIIGLCHRPGAGARSGGGSSRGARARAGLDALHGRVSRPLRRQLDVAERRGADDRRRPSSYTRPVARGARALRPAEAARRSSWKCDDLGKSFDAAPRAQTLALDDISFESTGASSSA